LRLENKQSRPELGGVSRSAIAQWEADQTSQILNNLERIAKVLGTQLAFLFSGEIGSLQGD
jgi:transcriptional regulator with XRE-family HTH domain